MEHFPKIQASTRKCTNVAFPKRHLLKLAEEPGEGAVF